MKALLRSTNANNSCVMYNVIPKKDLMIKSKEEIDIK